MKILDQFYSGIQIEQFSDLQIENKLWFVERQKQLIGLLRQDNQQYLKHVFNIDHNLPLVKITPNALIFLTGEMENGLPLLRGKFFLYEVCAKVLIPAIEKQEIASMDYFDRIATDPYKSFLHFADMEYQKRFPRIYLTQANFYAGAGDGYVEYQGVGAETLTTVHDATTGTTADATATTCITEGSRTDAGPNFRIRRSFFPTDTSTIGSGGTISAAILNLYATAVNNAEGGSYSVNQTTQASTSTLATADYDAVDTTHPVSPLGSNAIGAASITTSAYNAWTLNATGRGFLSVTGFSKIGLRIDGDTDGNHNPAFLTGVNNLTTSTSENAGTTQDPYLDITYTPPVTTRSLPYLIY